MSERTPEPRHIAVNGVRLAYDDVGKGPAILFIHGFMFDRTMWRGQVVGLEGWRRIAPDLRGMGLSEAAEDGYSMNVYADDLAALLDALDIGRTVLCGLSMGAYVAFEFLRRHRRHVAGLIVLDARTEADSAERKASRNDMIARVRNGDASGLADELASKFLAEGSPAGVRRRLGQMMERPSATGIIEALEAMRDRADSTPLLQSIVDLPTLLLIGTDDTRTPRASMQAMADEIPEATFNLVSNAGHLPPLENPEETTAGILRFLNQLGAVGL
ncbi:alpha/beta fold hydrolase [Glycomyces tenuis]|uniref:alpha/beta fold hydrolase n=1 Tax=Glycomyces tenuis TaxID=58116 RepID=UPI0004209F40|nr:alpha/beta hydrolase [Glycomyces tenuis]